MITSKCTCLTSKAFSTRSPKWKNNSIESEIPFKQIATHSIELNLSTYLNQVFNYDDCKIELMKYL